MEIRISLEIVPFGKIGVKIGSSAPSGGEIAVIPTKENVIYREPGETIGETIELWNQEGRNNYRVPVTTG